MTPQIIYILLFLVGLVSAGYKHGKPKTGTHDARYDIAALITMVLLLCWGGFFDCFIK